MGEIPSAYESVYLALHAHSPGRVGEKQKQKRFDNIRMERKRQAGKEGLK